MAAPDSERRADDPAFEGALGVAGQAAMVVGSISTTSLPCPGYDPPSDMGVDPPLSVADIDARTSDGS